MLNQHPPNSIFARNTKRALAEFIIDWSSVDDIDQRYAYNLALDTIRFYRGQGEQTSEFARIEQRWYQSLDDGEPDYGIYDERYLLSDIWSCWILFSRVFLKAIAHHRSAMRHSIVSDIGRVDRVYDLGCGFGYGSAALKELFPNADVIGTNWEGGRQWRVASIFAERYGFSMAPEVKHRADLIFASEYFEHIERPVEHMLHVLDICEPRALVLANSFGTHSIGHFREHRHFDEIVDGKDVGKLFGSALRDRGYELVETRCWNNRPAYWKRIRE